MPPTSLSHINEVTEAPEVRGSKELEADADHSSSQLAPCASPACAARAPSSRVASLSSSRGTLPHQTRILTDEELMEAAGGDDADLLIAEAEAMLINVSRSLPPPPPPPTPAVPAPPVDHQQQVQQQQSALDARADGGSLERPVYPFPKAGGVIIGGVEVFGVDRSGIRSWKIAKTPVLPSLPSGVFQSMGALAYAVVWVQFCIASMQLLSYSFVSERIWPKNEAQTTVKATTFSVDMHGEAPLVGWAAVSLAAYLLFAISWLVFNDEAAGAGDAAGAGAAPAEAGAAADQSKPSLRRGASVRGPGLERSGSAVRPVLKRNSSVASGMGQATSRRSTLAKIRGVVNECAEFYVKLLSTAAYAPIIKGSLRLLDCSRFGGDGPYTHNGVPAASLEESYLCFEGPHLALLVVSLALLAMFVTLSVYLSGVNGSLRARSRGDWPHVAPSTFHMFTFRTDIVWVRFLPILTSLIFTSLQIYIPNRPTLLASILLALVLALLSGAIRSPPYCERAANHLYVATLALCAWTNLFNLISLGVAQDDPVLRDQLVKGYAISSVLALLVALGLEMQVERVISVLRWVRHRLQPSDERTLVKQLRHDGQHFERATAAWQTSGQGERLLHQPLLVSATTAVAIEYAPPALAALPPAATVAASGAVSPDPSSATFHLPTDSDPLAPSPSPSAAAPAPSVPATAPCFLVGSYCTWMRFSPSPSLSPGALSLRMYKQLLSDAAGFNLWKQPLLHQGRVRLATATDAAHADARHDQCFSDTMRVLQAHQ